LTIKADAAARVLRRNLREHLMIMGTYDMKLLLMSAVIANWRACKGDKWEEDENGVWQG
ncbi:hypothetical protein PanWU01x14_006190, partial [Parasponia andersonii]